RPTVSAVPMLKLTSSTAWTWPTVRRNSPRRTGKYFFSPLTSNTGVLSGIAASRQLVGMPTGGPVTDPLFLVARIFLAAHLAGKGTAGGEATAGRQVAQGRDDAGDFLQSRLGIAPLALIDAGQARDRTHQPARVRVQRLGEEGLDRCFL